MEKDGFDIPIKSLKIFSYENKWGLELTTKKDIAGEDIMLTLSSEMSDKTISIYIEGFINDLIAKFDNQEKAWDLLGQRIADEMVANPEAYKLFLDALTKDKQRK